MARIRNGELDWARMRPADLVELLAPLDVFFVGVHCPLPELERRERQRGDRRPGEARRDFHVVHRFTEYDLTIDATQPNEDNVVRLITAWQTRRRPTAFERIRRIQVRGRAHRSSVRLGVLKANPARRLYERLGFVVVQEKERSYDTALRA
jgi:hypothetical protein